MKYILITLCVVALSGCFEATFPIGEGGKYGEAYAGYRLPYRFPFPHEATVYRDK